MSGCNVYKARRKKCHDLYGKRGEDCLVEELEEKRCVSFQFCPDAAKLYYGTLNGGTKSLCASWAENFAFSSTIEAEHHVRAWDRVNDSPKERQRCREIAMNLVKCMNERGSER